MGGKGELAAAADAVAKGGEQAVKKAQNLSKHLAVIDCSKQIAGSSSARLFRPNRNGDSCDSLC